MSDAAKDVSVRGREGWGAGGRAATILGTADDWLGALQADGAAEGVGIGSVVDTVTMGWS